MFFPQGGSQISFLPKNQEAVHIPHMGAPPSRTALETLSRIYYGKNPSTEQKVGRTALAAMLGERVLGSVVSPWLSIGGPLLVSAGLSIWDYLKRKRGKEYFG